MYGRRPVSMKPSDSAVSAIQRMADGIVAAVQRYRRFHGQLAYVLAASVAVQVLRVVQAYYLGRAVGITAGLPVYFAFVPLILLVMLLPITINGLGTSTRMVQNGSAFSSQWWRARNRQKWTRSTLCTG